MYNKHLRIIQNSKKIHITFPNEPKDTKKSDVK